MKNRFNSISINSNQNRTYDFSKDVFNRFSEQQMQLSIYAPELNAQLVCRMTNSQFTTIDSFSLLQGRSFIKF